MLAENDANTNTINTMGDILLIARKHLFETADSMKKDLAMNVENSSDINKKNLGMLV